MDKAKKTLILIDGNAIIHRAYHALPPLTTKSGELVNAVYGFSSTIFSVIDKFHPEYTIATFDLAGPTFRHVEFEGYKAHRVKADQELYDQIPRVKEVVRAMNIPILEKEGFEADDVIGTVAAFVNEKEADLEVVIVTGDLDTLQLINSKTKVFTMRRGLTDSVLYDEEKVMERYQFSPEKLVDFKGLRGDASDNIPGVKGIGEKTAIELLKKYETLEGVYANIADIKGALKEKLERDKMQAIQSKKLAKIMKDVPVEIDLEKARTHEFDRERLVNLFKDLNFFSLIKRIPGSDSNESNFHANSTNIHTNVANGGVHPVEYASGVPAKHGFNGVKDFKYEHIDEKKIDEFLETISEQKEIAMKLKTTGERFFNSEIKGIAIAWKNGRAGFIDYSKDNFEKLKNILENPEILKVGYDLKFDLEILRRFGIELQGISFDVMLAAYTLRPGGKIEFSHLVLEELGEEISENKKAGQLGLGIESTLEIAEKYSQLADYIWKLRQIYGAKVLEISQEQKAGRDLKNVFEKVEMPLIPILAEMEEKGVRLNKIIFLGISEKINKRILSLEKSIYSLAGLEFNINSPRQLAEVLFENLGISTANIKKGKTGYSTASAELEKIKDEHKIVEKIEEYREIFKLKTTYLDALPLLCDEHSRIHSSFNQAVAATGRLSSSDPNLQNIPIRTELGQLLRVAFEAESGWKLVAADYSQIDLRVVAHVSHDLKMIEMFRSGEDIHRATAAEINGVTLSQVTAAMRRKAKELNFGVIYGMGVFGFSSRTGISREEAKKFIDAYFKKFEGVARYMQETREAAKTKGYVETEVGRRRYIPEINSPNFQVQNSAERMAINLPIQGLTADIMKLAMIKVHEEFRNNPDVRMILQIHDEIILEVKENLAEAAGKKVKEIMEAVYNLDVPLIVEVKTGDNWGEV